MSAGAYGRWALFRFFLPLGISGAGRALIAPFLDAGVTRAGDVNGIASFALASSVVDVAASLPFMLQHAYVSLVHDAPSYRAFRRFTTWLSIVATATVLISVLPGSSHIILATLLGTPAHLADRVVIAIVIMTPVPWLYSWRFYTLGLLVERGHPGPVMWTAGLAIVLAAAFAALAPLVPLPPEILGAAGTLLIATAEWLTLRVLANWALRESPYATEHDDRPMLTLGATTAYYWPLAASQIAVVLARPLVNAGLLRLADPVITVAAFRLASSLLMVIQNTLTPLRPVVLVAARRPSGLRAARDVSLLVGLACAALVLALGTTDLGRLLLTGPMGAPAPVARSAQEALTWITLVPLALGLRQYQSGLLLLAGRTRAVGASAIARPAGVVAIMLAGAHFHWPGGAIGGGALAAGFLAEAAFSWWQVAVGGSSASGAGELTSSGRASLS